MVREYEREQGYNRLGKRDFPKLLKRLLARDGMKTTNIQSGFRASGLFPFDPKKVLENKKLRTGVAIASTAQQSAENVTENDQPAANSGGESLLSPSEASASGNDDSGLQIGLLLFWIVISYTS